MASLTDDQLIQIIGKRQEGFEKQSARQTVLTPLINTSLENTAALENGLQIPEQAAEEAGFFERNFESANAAWDLNSIARAGVRIAYEREFKNTDPYENILEAYENTVRPAFGHLLDSDEELMILNSGSIDEMTYKMQRLVQDKELQAKANENPIGGILGTLGAGIGEGALLAITGEGAIAATLNTIKNGSNILKATRMSRSINRAVRGLNSRPARFVTGGSSALVESVILDRGTQGLVDGSVEDKALNFTFGGALNAVFRGDLPEYRVDNVVRRNSDGTTGVQQVIKRSNEPVIHRSISKADAEEAHSNGMAYAMNMDTNVTRRQFIEHGENNIADNIENIKRLESENIDTNSELRHIESNIRDLNAKRDAIVSEARGRFKKKILTERQRQFFTQSVGVDDVSDSRLLRDIIRNNVERLNQIDPNGRDFNSVRSIVGGKAPFRNTPNAQEAGELIDQLAAARKIVASNDAEVRLDNLIQESVEGLDDELADLLSNRNVLRDNLDVNLRSINNYRELNAGFRAEIDNIGNTDLDAIVDTSQNKLAAFKEMAERAQSTGVRTVIPHTGEDLRDMRRAAMENGDQEAVDLINDFAVTREDGEVVHMRDISDEEANQWDFGGDVQEKGYVNPATAIGSQASFVEDDEARGFLRSLWSDPASRAGQRGRTNLNSAADHSERLKNTYQTQLNNMISEEYLNFRKRTNGGRYSRFRLLFGLNSHKRQDFMRRTSDYLLRVDAETKFGSSNLSNLKAEFDPEVVNLAERYRNLVGSAREDLVNHGWQVDEVENLFQGTFSRSRREGSYLAALNITNNNKPLITNLFEKMILKAQPRINERYAAIRIRDTAQRQGRQLTAAEQTELDRLDALVADETNVRLSDEEIETMLGNNENPSNLVARAYFERQLIRDSGGDPLSKASIGGENIFKSIEDIDLLTNLTDAEKANIRTFFINTAESSQEVNNATRRLDLNPDVEISVFNHMKPNGNPDNPEDYVRLSGYDFFSSDFETVAGNTMNQLSKAGGLSRTGISSFDEFTERLDNTLVRLNQSGRRDARIGRNIIEQTRDYFLSRSFYDNTGNINVFKRIVKKTVAASRLGYLPFSMIGEMLPVMMRHGLTTTIQNFPEITTVIRQIKAGRAVGLAEDFNFAGLQDLDVFDNSLLSLDTGVFQSNGFRRQTDRYGNPLHTDVDRGTSILNSVDRGVGILAEVSNSASRFLDITIRRLAMSFTMNNTIKLARANPDELRSIHFRNAGADDNFVNDVLIADSYITRNRLGGIDRFDAKRFKAENPEAFDRFTTTMIRLGDRQIQTNRVGNLPPLINTEAFSWLGQFKSFAFGTYNQQFRYGLNNFDTTIASMWTMQAVSMAIMTAARLKAQGKEDLINTPEDLLIAGIRNTSAFALPSMMIDAVTGNLLGKEYFSLYSQTGQTSTLIDPNSTTVISYGNDFVRAVADILEIGLSDDKEFDGRTMNKILRLLPLNNMIVPDFDKQ